MKVHFGTTADGKSVELYTLTNTRGLQAKISTYGGIVAALRVPDRHGKLDDVVLGCDTLGGYLSAHPYFGATIGRYANRIAGGRIRLEGREYQLTTNDEGNHLHGGWRGFDKVIWEAAEVDDRNGPALELRYVSVDGEEGYPGNLSVLTTYTVTEDNELRIDYSATTDQVTIVNLTHHSYFNLADGGMSDILDHHLRIEAEHFLPTDQRAIPTGEIRSVEGTPFDFRESTPVGARISDDDEQLRFGNGYNHTWLLTGGGRSAELAAEVYAPGTGRVMEVLTTEPGLQFFSGNFPDGTFRGKGDRFYPFRGGLCLEAQHYPDSPNHLGFPSTVLRPGEVYAQTTIYRFSLI